VELVQEQELAQGLAQEREQEQARRENQAFY
jgi:hypothetical protein